MEVSIEALNIDNKRWGLGAAMMALLLVSCSSGESPPAPEEDDDSTPVAGYEVETQDLSHTVRVSGTIEPDEWFRLKSHEAGVLTTLNVEEGDRVERGQLLASTELSEYRAELERTRAEISQLQRQLERKEPLLDREAIQEAEVEDLRSEIEVAERQADVWQTRISLGELRAPADAVVTTRYVDPGSSVSANEEVLELADLSTLLLPVRMSEREVVQLESDQVVEVTVDAYPEQKLDATVRRVFPTVDPDSRRVTVELALDELPEELEIKPGFRARAHVDIDRRQEMLAVPGESLLASDGDDEIVYVIEDNELVERAVESGIERRNWTEITTGLEAGEVVVGTNPTNLREGMRVHVSQKLSK